MKIDSYSMSLASAREASSSTVKKESLVYWKGGEDARKAAYNHPVEVKISDATLEKIKKMQESGESISPADFNAVPLTVQVPKQAEIKVDDTKSSTDEEELKLAIVRALLKSITGKDYKTKTLSPDDLKTDSELQKVHDGINAELQAEYAKFSSNDTSEQKSVGWGMEYNYEESYSESESVSFAANGLIRTADGREIKLSMSLEMSRSFSSSQSLTVKAGDALLDPLVINYAGSSASLSSEKISFDLNGDGQEEEIAALENGSGYLALDKDGDGRISSGKELFGPQSGSGFKDLSQYDSDGNNWIDENDKIYASLKIWNKSANGNEGSVSLAEAGIGAIYLGKSTTLFSLTDSTAAAQKGQIADTGIYLKENGGMGTVQELYLASSKKAV